MIRFSDGSLQIDSAYEADRIGRAAAYGREDAERLILTHLPGRLEATMDEVEFFNRDQKYGHLVIRSGLAAQAEEGLRASMVLRLRPQKGEHARLPHHEAAVLLGALATSRLSQEEAVERELSTLEVELEFDRGLPPIEQPIKSVA